jgi:hypothetical protein
MVSQRVSSLRPCLSWIRWKEPLWGEVASAAPGGCRVQVPALPSSSDRSSAEAEGCQLWPWAFSAALSGASEALGLSCLTR